MILNAAIRRSSALLPPVQDLAWYRGDTKSFDVKVRGLPSGRSLTALLFTAVDSTGATILSKSLTIGTATGIATATLPITEGDTTNSSTVPSALSYSLVATLDDGSDDTVLTGAIALTTRIPVTLPSELAAVHDITVTVPAITTYNTPVTCSAVLHDSVGGTITGRAVTWSTSAAPDIASIVAATGALTVLADGTFEVIATSADGRSGYASVTVAIANTPAALKAQSDAMTGGAVMTGVYLFDVGRTVTSGKVTALANQVSGAGTLGPMTDLASGGLGINADGLDATAGGYLAVDSGLTSSTKGFATLVAGSQNVDAAPIFTWTWVSLGSRLEVTRLAVDGRKIVQAQEVINSIIPNTRTMVSSPDDIAVVWPILAMIRMAPQADLAYEFTLANGRAGVGQTLGTGTGQAPNVYPQTFRVKVGAAGARHRALITYDNPPSPAQYQLACDYLEANGYATADTRQQVMLSGNSVAVGAQADDAFRHGWFGLLAADPVFAGVEFSNTAGNGRAWVDMEVDRRYNAGPGLALNPHASTKVGMAYEYTNSRGDLNAAGMETAVTTYYNRLAASGYTTRIVTTMLPTGTGLTDYGDRGTFNTWLKANYLSFATHLVDFTTQPVLETGSVGANPSYWYDDLHPNTAGHALIRDLVKPVVAAALGITLPPSSTTVVSDTFARADNTTTLGSTESGTAGVLPWVAYNASVWEINGNAARLKTVGTGSGADSQVAVNSGVADGSVSITLPVVSGVPWLGIVFRLTDASNYLAAFWGGTNLFLRKIVAGVATNLTGSLSSPLSAGDTLSVTFSGNTIHVYHNAVDVFGAVTEAFNQTATRHGIYALNADTTKADNFTVTVP